MNSKKMNRIENLKKKLDELKTLDKGFSIFGSERHKYRLNPTLSDAEIGKVEKEHGITLSPTYREMLIHLGNGGAGCGYGLESLSLKNIAPPYPGTDQLLRNWEDPEKTDVDMVDLDEISGYIKLFDYGSGMTIGLIVNGKEQGELIFFDVDGRFRKLKHNDIIEIYESWLDESIETLKRVKTKLEERPLDEVISSEWELRNFHIKEMILSLIDAAPLKGARTGKRLQEHLEMAYSKWKKE